MNAIWVDADSCPRRVREYLIRSTERFNLQIFFVANRTIPSAPVSSARVSMIICKNTSGAADDYIVAHAGQQDMVVTRDIPLAARLVDLNVKVLNDRGTVYSKQNIGQRLSDRDFNLMLAQAGLKSGKTVTYGKKEFEDFANCFDRELHTLLKQPELKVSISSHPGTQEE